MSDLFGRTQSSETRALKSIDQSKYPDTNRDLVKTLQRHGNQIDYMAKYMAVMQEGVDAANRNVIQQLQDFVNDIVVLLGGGQLLSTVVELGDLKYILPALGALFGFDGPFPVNLANAAMHFIFGYVVPQQQFTDAILDILNSWATFLGIDPKYLEFIRKLFDAITDLFGSLEDLLKSVTALLGGKLDEAFAALEGFGPLGKLLSEITALFRGIDLSGFPNIFDLILGVFAPFVDSLTDVINLVNGILQIFGASVDGDKGPLENWWQIFSLVDWNNPFNDTGEAIKAWFEKALKPIVNILTGDVPIPPNLIPNLGIGSLGFFNFNMLPNPGFNTAISLDPSNSANKGWSWDGNEGRSIPLGCARGEVRGSKLGQDMMLFSDYVNVGEGQKLNVSTYLKFQNLAYTGTITDHPVTLQVYGYDSNGNVIPSATKIVARSAVAGATSGNWVEAERLVGYYTVPVGVAKVSVGLGILGNATRGTVWFDDIYLGKHGLLDIAFTEGLGEMLDQLWQTLFGWVSELEDLMDTLGGKVGSTLKDIFDRLAGIDTKIAAFANEIAIAITNALNGIVEKIKDLTGLDLSALAALNPVTLLSDMKSGLQDFLDGIWSIFGGGTGTGKSVAETLAAVTAWITGPFKTIQDGLAAIVLKVQQFFDGITGLTGSTVAQAISAFNGFVAKIQELIDGIFNIWTGGSSTGNPIQNALDGLLGIFDFAKDAKSSAEVANIGIAALKAEMASGFSDEFNYPLSANLPVAQWIPTYTGNGTGTWGPDGNGKCVFKPGGIVGTSRKVIYRRVDNPLTGTDGSVTVVLSKAPHSDLLVKSYFWITFQCSANDQSRMQFKIGATTVELQSVSATGAETRVGAIVTIPKVNSGDVFEVKYTATGVLLYRNSIQTTPQPIPYTQLAGRHIGFGADQPPHTWIGSHPASEFAGIAWHP